MTVKTEAFRSLEELFQTVNNMGLTAFEVDQSVAMDLSGTFWILFYNSEEPDSDDEDVDIS